MRFGSLRDAKLLTIVLLLLTAGCGGGEQQAEQQESKTVAVTREVTKEVTKNVADKKTVPSTPEETNVTAQPEESLQVGETAELGDVKITVNNAYLTAGDEYDQAELQSGDAYVVLNTTVENEGDTTPLVDTTNWTLYNQDGQQLETAYVSALDDTPEYSGELRPGRQFSGPVPAVASVSDVLIVEYVPFESMPGDDMYATWDIGPVSELPEGSSGSQVAEETSANEESQSGIDEASVQQFISDYYAAVSDEDWTTTYSYLDEATQAEFSAEEWFEIQEAREASQELPPISSATVEDYSVEGTSYTANVTRNYEDGTSDNLDNVLYLEGDELKRHLTEEELSILRSF